MGSYLSVAPRLVLQIPPSLSISRKKKLFLIPHSLTLLSVYTGEKGGGDSLQMSRFKASEYLSLRANLDICLLPFAWGSPHERQVTGRAAMRCSKEALSQ